VPPEIDNPIGDPSTPQPIGIPTETPPEVPNIVP
jgi:hypothetical protein